jgi:hypothetical protein
MNSQDLSNRFTYHPPKDENQKAKYEKIRKMGFDFANYINNFCPEGREKSLAITKLEEACFWANAGIARNE